MFLEIHQLLVFELHSWSWPVRWSHEQWRNHCFRTAPQRQAFNDAALNANRHSRINKFCMCSHDNPIAPKKMLTPNSSTSKPWSLTANDGKTPEVSSFHRRFFFNTRNLYKHVVWKANWTLFNFIELCNTSKNDEMSWDFSWRFMSHQWITITVLLSTKILARSTQRTKR